MPSLTLAKHASPVTYSAAGDVITYTYKLTNDGNVTLAGPFTVTDDKLGTFACGTATSLAPGASVTCARSYVVKSGDFAKITAAEFAINSFDITNQTVRLHRVIAPWVESLVTWNNFGERFDPTVIGSFTTNATGWRSTDVTALAQAWADGKYPNDGMLLEQDLTPFTSYRSSEDPSPALRPMLTITYTLPTGGSAASITIQRGPTMPTAVPDAMIWQATPDTNYGSFVQLVTGEISGFEKQSLVKFDFALPCTSITNHATATAMVNGITVTSNQVQATINQAAGSCSAK